MGIFGPSRDERYAAAAAAIAPYGFGLVPAATAPLAEHAPFQLHPSSDGCNVAAYGRIEESDVWAYEYSHSSTDSEGQTSSYDQLIVVAHHPRIEGGAAFSPEPREWSGVARALDTIFWIPPFTLLKVIQWMGEARNPDRTLGDAEFDRLYRVRAASDSEAQRAIPRRLRETVLRLALRGTVELRPGTVIYSIDGCRFDGDGLVRALGYAAPLLVGAMAEPAQAYR